MPNTRKNPRDPDSPFITREGLRKGISFRERFPGVDPKMIRVICVPDEKTKPTPRRVTKRATTMTSVPVSRYVVTKLRATGPQWPDLADKILRDGLKKLKQKAA
jgi:uncharacterized protein (DUF4415 family)